MTDCSRGKHRKLSHEILGLIGLSALVALVLFLILSGIATAVAEIYCFRHEIPMNEFDWLRVDRWIFLVSASISVAAFSIIFLCLLNDRMAYIRKITAGIDKLQSGEQDAQLPLEGSNELTELAGAVNYLSTTQRQLREKEQALAQEKDELVRSLSHDIRTPLTSILAYSDLLALQENIPHEQQQEYMKLIRKKAEQIRDLTDILLDGSRRKLEQFADARMLMTQIAAEFEDGLDEKFHVRCDMTGCPDFSGTFDVQELRRIFDNLSTNILKYADPEHPVKLAISQEGGRLVIWQSNAVLQPKSQTESYGIGLNSIRRIAMLYDGSVNVQENGSHFAISITLSDFQAKLFRIL